VNLPIKCYHQENIRNLAIICTKQTNNTKPETIQLLVAIMTLLNIALSHRKHDLERNYRWCQKSK